MVFWEGYVSDEATATIAPILVYWLYAGLYQLLQSSGDYYNLHTHHQDHQADQCIKSNMVPLSSVIRGVLFQQLIQASVAQLVFLLTPTPSSSYEIIIQPSIPVQALQILAGMLAMDTWQYFLHRCMHQNKLLYKHIHSHHHRLIVPYAIGALYNHPLEALFLDTLGGAVSYLISGMSPRTAVFFFCFAVVKAVDDHSGLWLPGNVFHLFFSNNSAYHYIHHQLQGSKYNFSQPFFSIWDRLLGTHMGYQLIRRPQGGYELSLLKS